jgi:hypothetical protein
MNSVVVDRVPLQISRLLMQLWKICNMQVRSMYRKQPSLETVVPQSDTNANRLSTMRSDPSTKTLGHTSRLLFTPPSFSHSSPRILSRQDTEDLQSSAICNPAPWICFTEEYVGFEGIVDGLTGLLIEDRR